MKALEVSAFTRNNVGGNLAGVVILDSPINEKRMQEIAKNFNYSETVFVNKVDSKNFKTRFFTPTQEVELCGHATIAAFYTLKELGLISTKEVYQHTIEEKLKLLIEDSIFMEMSEAKLLERLDKNEVANILTINMNDIIDDPQVVKVGLADAMVLVKNKDVLNEIIMKKDEMISFSNTHNITGFHIACFDNGAIYTRNFAPACGIDEESATGTSSGSMFRYLVDREYISAEKEISFYQGDIMQQPSQIVVRMIDDIIWVGGKANIIKELEII